MKKWYKEGLHFKCTGCGGCCTGAPGYVFVNDEEIEALAKHLSMSPDAFMRKYTRLVGERYSLLEDMSNYDCVFLEEGKRCSVYEARPTQCKTFPWWPENLKSEKDWNEEARRCEGINHPEGKLYTQEEIDRI